MMLGCRRGYTLPSWRSKPRSQAILYPTNPPNAKHISRVYMKRITLASSSLSSRTLQVYSSISRHGVDRIGPLCRPQFTRSAHALVCNTCVGLIYIRRTSEEDMCTFNSFGRRLISMETSKQKKKETTTGCMNPSFFFVCRSIGYDHSGKEKKRNAFHNQMGKTSLDPKIE